ncbi:hypothetical protein FJ987_06230 [Mesorhizobium sp. CU2]|uniref:hypothetical protein n=1 Tax=unclassified Mesorhizobium TaxID=325217 RepID=UPI00112BD3AA|nr:MULTISPECIES: hypothetical protein [unclassified Mesorhizobium]TPN86496.1 hypothetical protein FJ988_06845 [Mesorhizobium sp. CU3]TPO19873.1 hypothetical protein FJ987_06230 [Mesorhizobium sp. CU2]
MTVSLPGGLCDSPCTLEHFARRLNRLTPGAMAMIRSRQADTSKSTQKIAENGLDSARLAV